MSETVRTVGFTLRTECSSCGMPLPLGPPTNEVECTQCHTVNPLPASLWENTLAYVDAAPAGEAVEQHKIDLQGNVVMVQVTTRAPHCEKCNVPFPLQEFATGVEQSFACPSCGDPASTYPTPEWVKSIEPAAAQLFVVEPLPDSSGIAADVATEASRPVALSCPQCGGALQITAEHSRVTPCQYCATDIFLPDAVWRRLHPVKQVQWWYLRLEGLTAKERAEVQAREQAERAKAKAEAEAAEERRSHAHLAAGIAILTVVLVALSTTWCISGRIRGAIKVWWWSDGKMLRCRDGDVLVVRNRTVTGPDGGHAIQVEKGCTLTLDNVKITSDKEAIYMQSGPAKVVIRRSRLVSKSTALWVEPGSTVHIESSHLKSGHVAIRSLETSTIRVKGSHVHGKKAIMIGGKARLVLVNSHISGTEDGIQLDIHAQLKATGGSIKVPAGTAIRANGFTLARLDTVQVVGMVNKSRLADVIRTDTTQRTLFDSAAKSVNPACDDVLKIARCMSRSLDAKTKAALEATVGRHLRMWRQSATNPQLRKVLVKQCRKTRENLKKIMQSTPSLRECSK